MAKTSRLLQTFSTVPTFYLEGTVGCEAILERIRELGPVGSRLRQPLHFGSRKRLATERRDSFPYQFVIVDVIDYIDSLAIQNG